MPHSFGDAFVLQYLSYAVVTAFTWWFIKAAKTALSSPLNKVPGPLVSRWTPFPIFQRVQYVHALHEKYGVTVRTGPNNIAFSDIKDVKTIHKMGSGFLKAKFYEQLMLRGTLVCIISNKEHTARRKHFSRAFSQQNILEWGPVIKARIAVQIAAMKNEGCDGKAADILAHFKAMASGVVVELCYGESTDTEQNSTRNALVQAIRNEILVPQSERVRNLPFYVRWLPSPIHRMIQWKLFSQKVAQPLQLAKNDEGGKQTLLTKALAENEAGAEVALPRTIIVKETIGFFFAGTDTTAVTATYLIWAILKHPEVHARLREEVTQLSPDFSIPEVQSLPYLHCVIQETLRLYGAVSSGLPRRTPKGGCQVGEVFVPEGTTVTTQSFTLHRNPEVFEDPLKFSPDRWETPTSEMKEAFMPFGIGARGCIGYQLAKMELALVAALFIREFPDANVSDIMMEKDMELVDRFVMKPRGKKCLVVLE